jgi:tRNA A37 threonylcarbamoyladenosine dehydratase/proteasome lid subunit RPN8/RPN11
MARPARITARQVETATVRMASPEFDELCALVFRRYSELEWATFARFGWRETPGGLILTLAAIDPPLGDDLDESVGHVKIDESYTLRTALASEHHPLAVGIIHSHPEECRPEPSSIDDDMDGYYGPYFGDFAPGRPYVSLIFSRVDKELGLSGRIFWKNNWVQVGRFAVERVPTQTWIGGRHPAVEVRAPARTARLNAAFGDEAAHRLRRSTVAVVGAGGTGSAAIEVLARAGVGRIIIVDPDSLDESNLERVHGSFPGHAAEHRTKVSIAREHILSIDPACRVEAFVGALPQAEVVDAVVTADVALGCTDQQHSRLALSDITVRYLVPSLDCGVMLEGGDGRITGQIVQLIRFLAADECPLCRNLVSATRLSQELMSEAERSRRRAAAAQAIQAGEDPDPYWHEQPQLNTVGYLTTIAGSMAAGFAIGWLTGRFDPPFKRLQLNLGAKFLDVTDPDEVPQPGCICRRVRGWADQAVADALITAPDHWPPPIRL